VTRWTGNAFISCWHVGNLLLCQQSVAAGNLTH
jgi:thiol-disulfide isomerase/thioredoxin